MYESYSKRISAILCVIGEIAFAGCFIGEITEIMDYHETLFLVHVVFAISMLFILVSTIKGIVKAPKENIYHIQGKAVKYSGWIYASDHIHTVYDHDVPPECPCISG